MNFLRKKIIYKCMILYHLLSRFVDILQYINDDDIQMNKN